MSQHEHAKGLLHPLQKLHEVPSNVTEQKALHALMNELISVQYKQLYALDELIRQHIDRDH